MARRTRGPKRYVNFDGSSYAVRSDKIEIPDFDTPTAEALAFIHRVERDNAEDFAGEIAADLRLERKRRDICGLALMMIREGCADPKRVAAEALEKARNILPGDPAS